MMKTLTGRGVIAVLIAALILPGCAPTYEGQRRQAEGSILGAAFGAIIGGIIGGGRGARIGAGVGLAAGFIAATEIDRRREQYGSNNQFYAAQIEQSQKVNQELSDLNTELRLLNSQRSARIRRLTEGDVTPATRNQLRTLVRAIRQDRRQLTRVHEELSEEAEVQEGVLQELIDIEGPSSRRVNILDREIGLMREQLDELKEHLETMEFQLETLDAYGD